MDPPGGCRGPADRGRGSRTRRSGRQPAAPIGRWSAGSREGRRSSDGLPSRPRAPQLATASTGARNEVALDGVEGRLCPAGKAELAEDVADVGPGRPFGYAEIGRDLLVAATPPDEPEDLELTFGQRLRRCRRRAVPQPSGKDSGGCRVEGDLVVVGRPDRRGDVVGVGILEDKAARSGLERGGHL